MRTAASAPYAARGIVLRTRPLGEKDRIVELFGPGIGRWSAVARGARGGKSKLGALSQPFVCARMLLARGRSLDTLAQGEIENAHFHIATNLLGAAWASYCCEVVASLPERHPEDSVFELLQATLGALDLLCSHSAIASPNGEQQLPSTESTQSLASDSDAEGRGASTSEGEAGEAGEAEVAEMEGRMTLLGHWFEARFLGSLGFGAVVGVCARCESRISVPREAQRARVAFSPTMGGTLCDACAPADPARLSPQARTLRLLHRLQVAEAPSQLPYAHGASEAELRGLLRRSLLAHLDIQPRSRRFLDDLSARPH